MSSIGTAPDTAADEWAISDEVVQLRLWGTNDVHVLPDAPATACVVGSADTCSLRLVDPSGLVSRQHACLERRGSRWIVRDLESKNGLRIDGARRAEFALAPGVEIGLGSVTLIAESAQLIALRRFLARLLGWGADRTRAVDHALRSVRMAATHRTALVLCGAGELALVARSLHRHARGADRPFIMCDPRRRRSQGNVRSTTNFEAALPALQAAAGGSLCVWSQRLPRDFSDAVAALRDPRTRVQLVICMQEQADSEAFLALPVTVPPLAGRPGDMDRIIAEYAEDAISELGAAPAGFTSADHDWVRMYSSSSLPEIEKGTRRLIAIREHRTIARAAEHLGMAPVSLARWIGRRQLPTHVEDLSHTSAVAGPLEPQPEVEAELEAQVEIVRPLPRPAQTITQERWPRRDQETHRQEK